jgi:hypothetical protein
MSVTVSNGASALVIHGWITRDQAADINAGRLELGKVIRWAP